MEEIGQPQPNRFNVRVYGLLFYQGKVLISRETYNGIRMTKFPGGGLDFGEGLEEALIREFTEELELPIGLGELYYINDFLQISAFNPKDQLLAIYYRVLPLQSARWEEIRSINKIKGTEPDQSFEWIPIPEISHIRLSFPVDKKVATLMEEKLL